MLDFNDFWAEYSSQISDDVTSSAFVALPLCRYNGITPADSITIAKITAELMGRMLRSYHEWLLSEQNDG